MMPDPCYFDDSLPRLVRVLASKLDRAQLEAGVVLRDAGGRLCFFGEREVAPEVALELGAAARAALGRYARPDRLFGGGGEAGAQRALRDPVALPVPVDLGDGEVVTVRYVDRRIVGADWLLPPSPRPAEAFAPEGGAAAPPRALRVAFSSLKGGVGRTTALTVVAAEQARRGRNVLVIDLDLEAPGIGSLLLSDDRMPGFGVIDYLLERNFGPVDPAIVSDMVGTSALTQEHGLVNVVPAIGARTLASPGNYLAKLSRAVIEALDEGAPTPLAGKLSEMLAALEAQRQYDLVLIDVRAGFAEIAAGPILTLDAEVLIFGTAQHQTLQDLRFLLAHLASLSRDVRPSPWSRLKMVHAKAAQAAEVGAFRDALWTLFSDHVYEESEGLEEFNFDVNAPEAPHYPILIPLDIAFADWEPVGRLDRLLDTYYPRTFADLVDYVEDLLGADQHPGHLPPRGWHQAQGRRRGAQARAARVGRRPAL